MALDAGQAGAPRYFIRAEPGFPVGLILVLERLMAHDIFDISDISTAEHYIWGGVCDGWHLLKDPVLSVIQERVPPSAGETPHYHASARQFFYLLSGIATMEFEGKKVTLGPNQGLYVAPNTIHRFVNNSDVEVVFLVISSPPTAGDRIELPGPIQPFVDAAAARRAI